MDNYRITLKPLEPFFFGGEHTFGKDESRQENKPRYFAKSEYFPQQSALLGMLRKTILNKLGLLVIHRKGEWIDVNDKVKDSKDKTCTKKELATKLVGNGAFSYENDFDIGKVIDNISPLYILKDNKPYFVQAKDRAYTPKYINGYMYIKGHKQNIISFVGYDPKKYVSTLLVSKDDEKNIDDIFEPHVSVGIKKSPDSKAEEDAFFLKKSYMFRDECFAFHLQCNHKDMTFLNNTIVSLGADQSSFMINIQKDTTTFEETSKGIFSSKINFDRIVLLSETLLSTKSYELCEFVLGERQSKRHLVSKNNKKHLVSHNKSQRYYLLERGAVLYTKELTKLEKMLNKTHLKKIGINIVFNTIYKILRFIMCRQCNNRDITI